MDISPLSVLPTAAAVTNVCKHDVDAGECNGVFQVRDQRSIGTDQRSVSKERYCRDSRSILKRESAVPSLMEDAEEMETISPRFLSANRDVNRVRNYDDLWKKTQYGNF